MHLRGKIADGMSASRDTGDASFDALLGRLARPEEVPTAPGASVGRYLVLSFVGAGGMGAVYAAWDAQLDRRVAVKLVLPRGGDAAARKDRFLREAKLLGAL